LGGLIAIKFIFVPELARITDGKSANSFIEEDFWVLTVVNRFLKKKYQYGALKNGIERCRINYTLNLKWTMSPSLMM
jgi:hypothetical protein